jgi:hypothetical protein
MGKTCVKSEKPQVYRGFTQINAMRRWRKQARNDEND